MRVEFRKALIVVLVVVLSYFNAAGAYYNPTVGRFSRMDPYTGQKAQPQSLHKCGYVHNNPVNRTDPLGLMTNATETNVSTAIQADIGISIAVNAMLFMEYAETKTHTAVVARNLNARIFSKPDIETSLPGGYKYFVHGTAVSNIWLRATGIDATAGPYDKDFGQGFYTFPLSDYRSIPSAIKRAHDKSYPSAFGGNPFLIVVRYESSIYGNLNKRSLINQPEWENKVMEFRSGAYTGPTGYDEIYGWTARFPGGSNIPQINNLFPKQHKFEQSGINKGMEIYGIVPLQNRIQTAGY